jgi:MoaA/NifB/PqqE/SkfB family radical SAM enzyme
LRDEDALYHTPAHFFSPDLLNDILTQARGVMGITAVVFTGGEPILHPEFERILEVSAASDLKISFVTNGWHFDRVWPSILTHREAITHVAFSLDGATAETHDAWRGSGSFERVVRAFSRCFVTGIPFTVKVGIRRDTIQQLEQIALFAARLGASSLNFAHIMPTSSEVEEASSLSYAERQRADQEIANLARIFKMKIGIDVGYHNLDVSPPCSALAHRSSLHQRFQSLLRPRRPLHVIHQKRRPLVPPRMQFLRDTSSNHAVQLSVLDEEESS